MPRYAPQSLPMGGSRPQPAQETEEMEQQHSPDDDFETHPAVSLGQHIRRERGMEGVRGYVVALREYLPPTEYQEVCRAMGVPADLPQQQQRPASTQQQPPVQETPQSQNNANNQMQMLQMLQMLMAMQNGGMGGNISGQPAMGNNAGGGMNPMMLAQLAGMNGMNGMNGMGGQNGGINPMMLAQLLGGMQK